MLRWTLITAVSLVIALALSSGSAEARMKHRPGPKGDWMAFAPLMSVPAQVQESKALSAIVVAPGLRYTVFATGLAGNF